LNLPVNVVEGECEWAHLQPAQSVADVDENSIKLPLTGSN